MSQTILLTDSRASGTIFDKRLGTNLIAAVLVVFGYWISEPWSKTLLNIGLFSLSGALTNWLAVYMLFERVPGIYGSGVIPLHFEDFKTGIRQLIMRQFFDRNNLEKFFSSFGPFLSVAGGIQALESLREPFTDKLHLVVQKIAVSEPFQQAMREKQDEFSASQDLHQKIDGIVTERLDELTPEMVKKIIENMIQKHLGWLVVWGGVFGGLIGLITSFVI